jgi:hypothetical protein
MNRRGFLGSLAAGLAGAAAIDPERLLWDPAKKLYSIPKRVHVPAVHMLYCGREVDPRDCLLGIGGVEFHERYRQPALASLRATVSELVRKSGGGTAKFGDLPIPRGFDRAIIGPQPGLPMVREIGCAEYHSGRYYYRWDVQVRI